jgi:uncharacterized membrane protein
MAADRPTRLSGTTRVEAFSDGVIWLNHHAFFGRLRSIDHAITSQGWRPDPAAPPVD